MINKLYVVNECIDIANGCEKAIGIFTTEEKAKNCINTKIAERTDDDFFDENGKYYRLEDVCRLSPIDCFSITTMKIDKIY
jgi:hypothetical protein